MRKELLTFLCLTIIFSASSANAANSNDWGILLQNTANTLNANTNMDTATLNETAKLKAEYKLWSSNLLKKENNLQDSFSNIVSLISPSHQSSSINNKINSIKENSILTEEQKSEQIAQVISNYSLNLQNSKTNVTKTLSKATTEQKDNISAAFNNLNTSYNEYASSISDGSKMLKSIVENPKVSLKLVKEYTELSSKIKTANNYLNSTKSIISLLSGVIGQ